MPKISFNVIVDNGSKFDILMNDLKQELKQTSDFQHANIGCYKTFLDGSFEIDIHPEDFEDIARSRLILGNVFMKVLNKYT